MFHIFFVNRGYMLRLEPPALGSIFDLQKCIASSTNVDAQDQFLFLSGGASLSSSIMLSAVPGVGTDTNPIFLVKRVANIQQPAEPAKENVEGINELYQGWVVGMDRLDRINSNSSSAIAECIDLAKKCATVADTIVRFCNNIISEHQYLHQGWLAVIANLDDNVLRIQRRLDKLAIQAEKLETNREKGRQLLSDFDAVLDTLSKIVIPPSLLSPIPSTSSSTTPAQLTDSDSSAEEMTLFDWISSKDPAYSLHSISQNVLDHLEKTDDSDLKQAKTNFFIVQDVAKKSQYRDIGGIDKRLAMLNTKLQDVERNLVQVREVTARILQPIIQDSTQNVVIWQKQQLNGLKPTLKNLYDNAHSFINSKDEVVKNICQRFSTWIRQAYHRLHECTKRIVLFDEKYSGLRQRLDLARQIKEAPNIYLSAVPEVIRREELKKEFINWVTAHIEKCSAFITEENKIRDEFQSKLNRHFLCQLFTGMGDKIPQFTTQSPPKIDQNLPKVTAAHLSELRKAFPNMKDLLIVGAPRIFHRLTIMNPSQQQMVQSQLRREQSFYDRDRTSNMDEMNRNFPSTNWLSEETMEFVSPSVTTAGGSSNFLGGMARGVTSYASSSSLNSIGMGGTGHMLDMQSPPHELGPLSEHPQPHFSLTTTSSSSTIVADQSAANRASSLSPLQPSAPISIPMPNQQQQQKDAVESIGSNHFSTPEEFGSFGSNSGGTGGRFIGITTHSGVRGGGFIPHHEQSSQTLGPIISSPDEFESKLTNVRNELKEMAEIVSGLRELGLVLREKSEIPENLPKMAEQIEILIKKKETAVIDEYKGRMQIVQTECNEKIAKFNEQLENERRIRETQEKELADKHLEISQLNEQMILIMKERDELMTEAAKKREEAPSQKSEENIVADTTQMTDVATQELAMGVSQSMIEFREECPNPSPPISDEDEGVSRLSSRSCGTQTRIRSKDMMQFVSLNDVREGFGALIIWNSQMNAFMAHCSTPNSQPHIVKDSSLERLGIRKPPRLPTDPSTSTSSVPAAPQRTWAFVIVQRVEPCQIRKASNRYNLPIDTRFFRIEVQPMPGDFGSSMSSTSSITSSSRR